MRLLLWLIELGSERLGTATATACSFASGVGEAFAGFAGAVAQSSSVVTY